MGSTIDSLPQLAAGSRALRLNFAALLPLDLNDKEKHDFLELLKGMKDAIIIGNPPREFEPSRGVYCDRLADYGKKMDKAREYAQDACDLMEKSRNAPNGEASYKLLHKVYNRLGETINWLVLAEESLKNFKVNFESQFNETDKENYQTFVDDLKKAMSKAKEVKEKLCARLGDYCPDK